jgi:hypothetical protein
MNKCLKKESGQYVAEKRGWHWILTNFAAETWEEVEDHAIMT